MEQRDSTPLKHHSETANPNMTTTQTCHFHETLRLCSEMYHLSCMTYHFYANHNGIAAQTDTRHVHEKSLFGALPNGRAIGAGFEHLRTVADGCGRLRTVANTKTTTGEHSSTLRLSKLNENPSLRIRENMACENIRVDGGSLAWFYCLVENPLRTPAYKTGVQHGMNFGNLMLDPKLGVYNEFRRPLASSWGYA